MQYAINENGSDIRKMSAIMHYHYKTDPDNWSDEKFFQKWTELQWVLSKIADPLNGG